MQLEVEMTFNKRPRQTRPLGTSGFTLDGNRRNLTFTGGPPRSRVIELQDEHEAEATGPVDEFPDETSETEFEEWEKKMIKRWETKMKRQKGQPFAVRKDGRGSDRRSEDQAPSNQKLEFLKAKLEEDQTSTGKAQGKTRRKKVCDPENDQESELQRQGGNSPQTPGTPEKMLFDFVRNINRHAMQER